MGRSKSFMKDEKVRSILQGQFRNIEKEIELKKNIGSSKRYFTNDWKFKIKQDNKILRLVKEDRSDLEIVDAMYEFIEGYTEYIKTINYENALKRCMQGVTIDQARKLYPNVEFIAKDFNIKSKEDLKLYATTWVSDIRINMFYNNQINRYIHDKIKKGLDSDQIMDDFIEKKPEIQNLLNLKQAVQERINSEIRKNEEQEKMQKRVLEERKLREEEKRRLEQERIGRELKEKERLEKELEVQKRKEQMDKRKQELENLRKKGIIKENKRGTARKKTRFKPKKGLREEFLEKYKVIGFDDAKKEINSRFDEEMFSDEILKQWIQEDQR